LAGYFKKLIDSTTNMNGQMKALNWLLGLAGAVGGGAIGFFIFVWLLSKGYYAMILPGAALGLAGGALIRCRSLVFGVVCGLLAVLLGIFTEWWTAPFREDKSFSYFLTHLHQLQSVTIIMIALGGICAFWFGQGRERFNEVK
jgi:hypothetical protein